MKAKESNEDSGSNNSSKSSNSSTGKVSYSLHRNSSTRIAVNLNKQNSKLIKFEGLKQNIYNTNNKSTSSSNQSFLRKFFTKIYKNLILILTITLMIYIYYSYVFVITIIYI